VSELLSWLQADLTGRGLAAVLARPLAQAILLAAIALVAVVANFTAKRIILRAIKSFISRTDTKWDDAFLHHKVFDRMSHLAPAMVFYATAAIPFPNDLNAQSGVRHVAIAYMFVMTAVAIDGLLSAVSDIYYTFQVARSRPIKSYVQVGKIIVYLVTAILVIATLTDRSPWGLLSGLGAMTAILMLVFKDSILGLVASIQVTANDMVRPGDWIEMPKYGVDGDVLEVSLNTVKIRNFDKTISTIPTYALTTETFKNWRGMNESGGRRIKRALLLDIQSVKFCDETLLERLGKVELLADFLKERRGEVARYNEEHGVDTSVQVNGRRLTNLGTFRTYVVNYLRAHPRIHHDMTLIVRHLPPTDTGLPLELYVFSNDQNWARYETIQADIFDHLLAALPTFELRAFQAPSGADVRSLHAAPGRA
jgi:miniconductance mechanosensitive channel